LRIKKVNGMGSRKEEISYIILIKSSDQKKKKKIGYY